VFFVTEASGALRLFADIYFSGLPKTIVAAVCCVCACRFGKQRIIPNRCHSIRGRQLDTPWVTVAMPLVIIAAL